MPDQLELVYPLYLDVPMMTSFVAAIEDGVAYDSDVTQRKDQQQALGGESEARVGIPFMGALSTLIGLDFRGRISGDQAAAEGEEIKLVRRHTEASLFMRLRQALKNEERIVGIRKISDFQELRDSKQNVLVEVSGQIFRSPLSEVLEAVFRVFDILGYDLSGKGKAIAQNPQKGRNQRKRGQGGQQLSAPTSQELELDAEGQIGFQIMQRIKDDLAASKVLDVVMRPSAVESLAVVIALATEYLPEGAFDNLLSGDFTVLGKVTRVVEEDAEISLYQRTMFNNINSSEFDKVFAEFAQNPLLKTSGNPMTIKAPALQIMPLAIYA
jgi:hypothetical protein